MLMLDELSEMDDVEKQEEYMKTARKEDNNKGGLGGGRSPIIHLTPELENEYKNMCNNKDKK